MNAVMIVPTMDACDFAKAERTAHAVVDMCEKLTGLLIESIPPSHAYAHASICRKSTVDAIKKQIDLVNSIMTAHMKFAAECRERGLVRC